MTEANAAILSSSCWRRACSALALATASVLGGSACGPDVPADPSYEHDVKPILAARCLRCHSPQYFGSSHTAPYDFTTYAAASMYAPRMPDAIKRDNARMPLGARPLDDWQIETIENWARKTPPNP
jgi:hypothetical protein